MLHRLVKTERFETPAVAWSFAYFFCLLSAYYILRPVRDEMGIQGGVQNLPWLFTATFLTMLAAVPLFGWLTARHPRRVALPVVYGFFIVNLGVFFIAFQFEALRPHAARLFFVWVSVFNLFVVSVFWSFMVDLFSDEQGKRLFGFIAAGGTTGAIAGPALTTALATTLGPVNLLWISAALLALAVFCIYRLLAWADARTPGERETLCARTRGDDAALGGGVWAGFAHLARSPYLLGVCFYLFCYTALSTLLYVEMARLVSQEYTSPRERTQLFAALDLAVNVLTLALQVGVAGRMLTRIGVTATLALLPAFAALGFAVLAAVPTLAVLVAFGIVRRAGEFALSKPAREVLFTVVAREEKYKAKNAIDTVVYRGGDMLSSWLVAALRGLGFGLAALSLVAVPLALAWLASALWLGHRYHAARRD